MLISLWLVAERQRFQFSGDMASCTLSARTKDEVSRVVLGVAGGIKGPTVLAVSLP